MTNKTAMSCLLLAVALGSLSGCGGGDSSQSSVGTPNQEQQNDSQPGIVPPPPGNTDTETGNPDAETAVKLEVSNPDISVVVGQQDQKVKVVAVSGDESRTDVTSKVIWLNSNPEVADIKDRMTGELIIKKEGSTVLTATYEGQTVEIQINVAPVKVTALIVNTNQQSIAKGLPLSLSVIGELNYGQPHDVTSEVTFRIDDTNVIDVTENGLIAKNIGSTSIYAELDGIVSKPAKVEVTDAILNELTISPDHLKMIVGMPGDISARGFYSDGTSTDVSKAVNWHIESSDLRILSSNQILANKVGEYKVYATLDGKESNHIDVEVAAASLEKVEVQERALTLATGTEKTLQAKALYNNGLEEDASKKAVWTSNDNTIAVFEGATLKALKPGTTTLHATLENKTSSAISLTVTGAMLEEIVISPSDITMSERNIKRFKAIGKYSDKTSSDITNQVTWNSSDKSILELINGGFSSSSMTGKVTITASYKGKQGATSVTVTDQLATMESIPMCSDSMTYAASIEQGELCLKTAHNGDNRLFTAPPTVDLLEKLGYEYAHALTPEATYGKKYSGYFAGNGELGEEGVVYAAFNQMGVDRAGMLGQYARWCEDLNTMKFAGRDNWRRATVYDMFSLYNYVGGNIYDGKDFDGNPIPGVKPIGWPVLRTYATATNGMYDYIPTDLYDAVNMRVGRIIASYDILSPAPSSCVSYNPYVPLPEVKR